MYLARAHYKCRKLAECKQVLLKAGRVAPHDTLILYNIALVLQKLATQTLKEEKSDLMTVLCAVHELDLAQKYFRYLSQHGDKMKYDLIQPSLEARQCQDLLSQAQYHVARARRLDAEEKEFRRKQEGEREALRQKILEQQKKQKEERLRQEQELIMKRQEFVEKSKSKLVFTELDEKPREKRRKADNYVSDSNGSDAGEYKPKERKKKEGDDKDRKKKKNRMPSDDIETYNERNKESDKKSRKRRRKEEVKEKKKPKEAELTSKQKSTVVSKATISSSEDSDSEKERPKKWKKHIFNY